MEKKQLNLNAPLLSVRKPTSKSSFPDVRKSKPSSKSGPIRQYSLPAVHKFEREREQCEVTKPGSVPFVWEQIPGRSKGGFEDQTENPKRSASAPRLPPGRLPDSVLRYSGERCNDPKIARHFSVERSNDQKALKLYSGDQKSGRLQSQVYPLTDHAALIASLRDSMKANEESDAESGDDAYSDTSASFSFNCSLSGLSGSDAPNMKKSGKFDADVQTRDFMLSRFLPAAKAAVVDTPHYTPKKQPVVIEQPKQPVVTKQPKQPVVTEQPKQTPKREVSGERRPLLDQFEAEILAYYNDYGEDVQSEVDDTQTQPPEPKKRSGKGWGIFPRLCVKKSLCLFNPVPSIKTKPQVPKSPPTDVSRLTRKAYSGPLDKQIWDTNHKRIFHSGVLTRDLHRAENKPGESKQFVRTSYKAGGLSPYRTSRSGEISPYRTSRSGEISPYRNASPQSPFRKEARFLGLPKEADPVTAERYSSLYKKCSNLLDAAPPRISRPEGVSLSPDEMVEKTLYVDTVTTVARVKDLASSRANELVNSSGENLKTAAEAKRMEDNPSTDIGDQEMIFSDIVKDGSKLYPKSSSLALAVVPSKLTGDLELNKKFCEEEKKASEVEQNASALALLSPLAPPLPKSPSESWLWRTLPSIHMKIPFSPSHNGKKSLFRKGDLKDATPGGTKWENMVKSSNRSGRISEEHFPRVSHKHKKV